MTPLVVWVRTVFVAGSRSSNDWLAAIWARRVASAVCSAWDSFVRAVTRAIWSSRFRVSSATWFFSLKFRRAVSVAASLSWAALPCFTTKRRAFSISPMLWLRS